MNCKICGDIIPEGRIKAIPNTTTCVKHSTASKLVGTIVSHGSKEDEVFTELNIITLDQHKQIKRLERLRNLGGMEETH